jgi:hypothetical protein
MGLLYSPGGLFMQLDATSRERCLTRDQLETLVLRRTDRAVRFERTPSGCATVADVLPAADGYGIVGEIAGARIGARSSTRRLRVMRMATT